MKILVIDTQGPNGISQTYRELLPGVRIRGRELASVADQPCSPHGAWCGWLAAAPRAAAGVETDLVFVRCFDGRNRWITGCEPWLLDVIEAEQPDYVSRSWGAWDGDDPLQRQIAMAAFQKFGAEYSELIASDDGPADFGASGNNDANDADPDVAFPQAQLARCNVIGACDQRRLPQSLRRGRRAGTHDGRLAAVGPRHRNPAGRLDGRRAAPEVGLRLRRGGVAGVRCEVHADPPGQGARQADAGHARLHAHPGGGVMNAAIRDIEFAHAAAAAALRDAERNNRIDEPQFQEMVQAQAERTDALRILKRAATPKE